MVHERQRLPLGLEAGDHLARVHAGLEHFEGDLAADGLGLFGHENDAESPLADLLQQLVRANHRSGAFRDRLVAALDSRELSGVEEPCRLLMSLQESLHALSQVSVSGAGLVEESRALGWAFFLQGFDEDGLFPHR